TNASNHVLLIKAFAAGGAHAAAAASVADALPLLESASARREPFNLAVIDANLPGEDGYDAAERIRARLASPMSVIRMLRTDRQREDIARCGSFGIEHYVV